MIKIIDVTLYKFMIVGVANTIVGMIIMFTLYNLVGWGYWLSSAIAFIIASIMSFYLNKNFTFQAKDWNISTVLFFIFTIGLAYLIAYSLAKPFINSILTTFCSKTKENIALFVGMIIFTGLNYLGQKYLVFRKN